MARFSTVVSFDVQTFDFNWYKRNYYDEALQRGANDRIDGVLYKDWLVLNGFNAGTDFWDDYYLVLGGSGLTGSIANGTVSGTVTLMGETWADQYGDQYALWGMSGISLSARSIWKAGNSASRADDLALFASALKGNDLIELSDYDDRMMGFAGNDRIFGYAGDDTIQGGKGRDQLYGGADYDSFIFDDGDSAKGGGSSGRDIIHDFESGIDVVNVRLIDANTRKAGDQSFVFSDNTPAKNAIWYANSGSNTIIYGDTNGDGKADFEIELRNIASLSAADFIL